MARASHVFAGKPAPTKITSDTTGSYGSIAVSSYCFRAIADARGAKATGKNACLAAYPLPMPALAVSLLYEVVASSRYL